MGKPYPHVWKLFGKACAEFNLISGNDTVLVPIDATGLSMSLLFWLNFKSRRIPVHFKIIPVHFYDGIPCEKNVEFLKSFCIQNQTDLILRSVSQPHSQTELYSIYILAAQELGCNKIALTDSLDYLDQLILYNMCRYGIFECPPLLQSIPSTSIFFIRPFGLLTDDQLSSVSKGNNYPEEGTAIKIDKDPALSFCKSAIDHLLVESDNIRMNLFHSQFSVSYKYIGVGDGSSITSDDINDELQ